MTLHINEVNCIPGTSLSLQHIFLPVFPDIVQNKFFRKPVADYLTFTVSFCLIPTLPLFLLYFWMLKLLT